MSVNGKGSGVAEDATVRHAAARDLAATTEGGVEAVGEDAEAGCVVEEKAAGKEGADNGAPGDGSEETPSPGARRLGLRDSCVAFLKRFEAGTVREGGASGRSSDRSASPVEAVRDDASDPSAVEAGEATTVLQLPDEDVRLGVSAAKASDRQRPRVLKGLSRNPAAVAIGVAASGGVSILVLSLVLGGGGSAPSVAMQKGEGGSPSVMRLAEPGLMAPSAKLATVALPEPQSPVVKPRPEKKAADELRDEVLSFGDRSAKTEEARVGGASEKVEPKPVVLEPGLSEPGVERASGSVGKGAPSSISATKPEGAHAAGEVASGGGEARSGRGAGQEVQSVEAPATTHRDEAPKEAGVGGDPPGFLVAVARPEDRGRSRETGEEKPPAIGQERSRRPQDEVTKEALGLVTQLGALLAEAREEIAALKVDHERLRSVAEGRLGDLDNRIMLMEAKSAVAEARLAGKSPGVAAASPLPIAAAKKDPIPADEPVEVGGEARIVKVRAVERSPSRETGGRRLYRVQAASPNLAMLAEIERSGDIGAQIEVALGDEVAGYGRVKKIVQRGTAWVVQMEKGAIE